MRDTLKAARTVANARPPIPTVRLSSFYFAYYAALGAFTPYWSLFLEARGQDVAAISILMSLWYATRIVAPTSWSLLAARTRNPIRWLHIGCLLTVVGISLFLVPLDFAGLFLAMCFFCFAWNAVMPQFEAITLSHLVGSSERYGAIRVWGSIGFIAVAALFGVVFDYLSVIWLPLLMLPFFIALLGSSFANDYARAPVEVETGNDGFLRKLKHPEALAFLGVAFLMQVSFGPYYTFFSLYLEQHGYQSSSLGMLWAVGVAVEIVVFFLSARIFARWDATRVLILALVSAALRWWVTALWPEQTALMVCAQLTHAINFAAFFASCMQLLARLFPGRAIGHGQGAFYGFSSGLGGVIGALLAGWMWNHHGSSSSFMISGFIALAAALIAWRWLLPHENNRRKAVT